MGKILIFFQHLLLLDLQIDLLNDTGLRSLTNIKTFFFFFWLFIFVLLLFGLILKYRKNK